VFTLFRGLRWDTGTDWESYYTVFLYSEWDSIFTMQLEPGYILLNVLIKSIGGNYTLFLLLTNLFVLMAYMKFALTNSNTPVCVFALFMFSTQFFPVRIGIAVAFIILGLCNFSQKNHFRIIAYTLIAMSVHLSAIIFIPVWLLIFCKKIPTAFSLTIAIALVILVNTGILDNILLLMAGIFNYIDAGMISHKFEHYLDYGERSMKTITGNITSIIYIASLIPFGYVINRITNKTKKRDYIYFFNTYLVFTALGIIFSNENMVNLKRLQNHLVFAFPILFSAFIYFGKQQYPMLRTGFTIMFIGYVLFRSYVLFFNGYPDAHFPYISVFHDDTMR
jgi:hypothetical protein